MISLARSLGDGSNVEYEIQMLMSVRDDVQRQLAADGVDIWQYAPFGSKWAWYFYRRIGERKESALFAVRALID